MRLTRKVLIFFFLFVSVFVFTFSGAEQKLSVEEQKKLSLKGRDLLLARNYAEAEVFLQKIVNDWPEELLGTFGLMALYQVRNLENFDFRFDSQYKPWEEKGRRAALKITRNPNADPWDLLLAGGTLGISGFYRFHNEKWFAALRDASTAFHSLEKCYRKDPPKAIDALLGIGLYDYWRSHFTRKLRFLPFFPDRREEGIAKMIKAKSESEFSSVLGEISLAFIDFQEKRYPKVMETTGGLLKRYPQNTILRMLRGETLLAMKKYAETIKEFEAILSIDPSITKSYLFIGMAYAKEGKNPEKAKEFLTKFLEAEPNAPSHWRKPAVEKLKKLEKD